MILIYLNELQGENDGKVDGTKVAVAGLTGAASGQAGAITQAITGSAKSAIKVGAAVDVVLSPGIANADSRNSSSTGVKSNASTDLAIFPERFGETPYDTWSVF